MESQDINERRQRLEVFPHYFWEFVFQEMPWKPFGFSQFSETKTVHLLKALMD